MIRAEKRVALRLAALNPSDQAWILRRLGEPRARRIRALMAHPLVVRASAAGIDASDCVPASPVEPANAAVYTAVLSALVERPETGGLSAEWTDLLAGMGPVPPALAASVARFTANDITETAA